MSRSTTSEAATNDGRNANLAELEGGDRAKPVIGAAVASPERKVGYAGGWKASLGRNRLGSSATPHSQMGYDEQDDPRHVRASRTFRVEGTTGGQQSIRETNRDQSGRGDTTADAASGGGMVGPDVIDFCHPSQLDHMRPSGNHTQRDGD